MSSSPGIRYAKTEDGLDIAFAVFGEGPMIFDVSQVWGSLHTALANVLGRGDLAASLVALGWSVVLFDARGTGSSTRDVSDFSLEARMKDVDAVVGQFELERFPVMAWLQGTPLAIEWAIQHPERVSHLVLINPFAVGVDYYASIPAMGLARALREMASDQWEFFTQSLASAVSGFRDMAEAQAMAAAFRSGMGPKEFVAWREAAERIDLTARLGLVQAPTLVIQDTSHAVSSERLARAVAAGIPNSRYIETADEGGATSGFLGGRTTQVSVAGATRLPVDGSSMAVVLFIDVVDSTAITEQLGDAAFRAASKKLDDVMRAAMAAAGGSVVEGKVLGDGVMGVFGTASAAIAAALRCVELSAASELRLHVGLHAGDVIHEGGNVYGGAVNVASRVCGLSAPGEVLVSGTVRELARTSAGVGFEDWGERELKGVGELVRVYAVVSSGQ